MKKILLILLCGIAFSSYALEPTMKDLDELDGILKMAQSHINDNQIKVKLDECSNHGNKYCSLTIGIHYFREAKYDVALPYLLNSNCKFKSKDGKDYWPASIYLGTIFFKGFGIEKNYEKSIGYYKQCAMAGEEKCAFMMAGVYNELQVKNHDPVPSNAWMKVAMKMGMTEIEGPKNANISVKESIDFMQESLTPEEIEKGDKLAKEICATIPKCAII